MSVLLSLAWLFTQSFSNFFYSRFKRVTARVFPEFEAMASLRRPIITVCVRVAEGGFWILVATTAFLLLGPFIIGMHTAVLGIVDWFDAKSPVSLAVSSLLQSIGFLLGIPAGTLAAFKSRHAGHMPTTREDVQIIERVLAVSTVYTLLASFASLLLSSTLAPIFSVLLGRVLPSGNLLTSLVLSVLLAVTGSVFALPPIAFQSMMAVPGPTGQTQAQSLWATLWALMGCWQMWAADLVAFAGFLGTMVLVFWLVTLNVNPLLVPLLFQVVFIGTTFLPSTPLNAVVNFFCNVKKPYSRDKWRGLADSNLHQLEVGVLLSGLLGGLVAFPAPTLFVLMVPSARSQAQNVANIVLTSLVRRLANKALSDIRGRLNAAGVGYTSWTLKAVARLLKMPGVPVWRIPTNPLAVPAAAAPVSAKTQPGQLPVPVQGYYLQPGQRAEDVRTGVLSPSGRLEAPVPVLAPASSSSPDDAAGSEVTSPNLALGPEIIATIATRPLGREFQPTDKRLLGDVTQPMVVDKVVTDKLSRK